MSDKAIKLTQAKTLYDNLRSMVAVNFDEDEANAAGSYVCYQGAVYLLPDGHTAGTTWANTTKVGPTNIGGEVSTLKSAITQEEEILDIQDFQNSRNLNNVHYVSRTGWGMTFTVNADNSVSLSGDPPSANAYLYSGDWSVNNRFYLPKGKYTLSGRDGNVYPYLILYDTATDTTTKDTKYIPTDSTYTTFETVEDYYGVVNIYVAQGTAIDGKVVYPQLEKGEQATEYISPFATEKDSKRIKDLEESGWKGSDAYDELKFDLAPTKNLNKTPYEGRTQNGVTFTVNEDNSITMDGTATGNAWLYGGTKEGERFVLPTGKYVLSGGISGEVYVYINFYDNQQDTSPSKTAVYGTESGTSFETYKDYYCAVQVQGLHSITYSDKVIYPQIEKGNTKTDYVSPWNTLQSTRLLSIESEAEETAKKMDAVYPGDDMVEPRYYHESNYIENKCSVINETAKGCAKVSDAFLFVTDMHWHLNEKHSPALLRYVKKHTRIDKLFCGGDVADYVTATLPYEAMTSFYDAWDDPIYVTMGNHEYLVASYGKEGRLYYTFNYRGNNRIGDFNRQYFYVDNPQAKLRYIVLNGFAEGQNSWDYGYEQTQLDWLEDVALNLETGWGAIIITHMTHAYNFTTHEVVQEPHASSMLSILDSYNGNGEIIAVISGHTHVDYLDATTGGIPIIVCTSDKNGPWIKDNVNMEPWLNDRLAGTIKEQAFDAFIVDRDARKIKQVRIGCPIRYGSDPETWTEYETAEISY